MALNCILRKCVIINKFNSVKGTRIFSMGLPALNKKEIEITFVRENGDRIKAKGRIGESLLDVVINNDIDFDGFGACGATLTCSTCHVVFKKQDFDAIPDKLLAEEIDMMEHAPSHCETSRLACQVTLSEKQDGIEVFVPAIFNDQRS